MTYTLQIAASRHNGREIYQVLSDSERSMWYSSIESAWKALPSYGTSSNDSERHHIKFTTKFTSLEALRESYPELFI